MFLFTKRQNMSDCSDDSVQVLSQAVRSFVIGHNSLRFFGPAKNSLACQHKPLVIAIIAVLHEILFESDIS